jgi:hypothetical protein
MNENRNGGRARRKRTLAVEGRTRLEKPAQTFTDHWSVVRLAACIDRLCHRRLVLTGHGLRDQLAQHSASACVLRLRELFEPIRQRARAEELNHDFIVFHDVSFHGEKTRRDGGGCSYLDIENADQANA